MEKTYYKTASLISNSCKAIAILAGQTAEVAVLAFEYGKNLVCIFVDLQSIVWCFQLQIAMFSCCCCCYMKPGVLNLYISLGNNSVDIFLSICIMYMLYMFLNAIINSFSSVLQGLAFQLIDDVLDFTGTSASLGKGSLSDIQHVISQLNLILNFMQSWFWLLNFNLKYFDDSLWILGAQDSKIWYVPCQ